jgi:aquaporin rerated protein, other eukaryote
MFLTAQLVFTIFMLAAEKHRSTFIAPIGIGLSLFIAELMGVYYTGGSLNPARSFGPCVILGTFHSYHWIYWVGPILGALLASAFYMFIKALEYETFNPEQDSSGNEGRSFDPHSRSEKKVDPEQQMSPLAPLAGGMQASGNGRVSVDGPEQGIGADDRTLGRRSDSNGGRDLEAGVTYPAP